MQSASRLHDHVEPLRSRRSNKDLTENIQQSEIYMSDYQEMYYDQDDLFSPRARFQNFLRASYPFSPEPSSTATTVPLPLAAGDIILVHSIHTNGWADGTLLETGARGWLPTNYCEPYDYAMMRPLLKALTDLWDVVRLNGNQSVFEVHANMDNMRGVVAGIRYLLEKTDCLTRDSLNVKRFTSLRKSRKGLLADLSVLVKACKTLGQNHYVTRDELDNLLDSLMLKAFQVVTRGASFFDTWSEELTLVPGLTPTRTLSPFPSSPREPSTTNISVLQGGSKRTSLYSSQTSPMILTPTSNTRPRPASITRPAALTHRMSYIGHTLHQPERANFASEQLSDTYDAFLGVLASFLGSHMQSRSSSELLLTTQQAVKSCRRLLEIVEIILEHDRGQFVEDLRQSKDDMYDKIAELVDATRAVFRPLHSEDEDIVCLPEDGAQLVNAATACVSDAGRCVAKARLILEDMGDFELELDSGRGTRDYSDCQSPFPPETNATELRMLDQSRPISGCRPSRPSLHVAVELGAPSYVTQTPSEYSSNSTTQWTPQTEAISAAPLTSPTSLASLEILQKNAQAQTAPQESVERALLHGSESTLASSIQDSRRSRLSQTSTRATSPEVHTRISPKLGTDDENEGEDAILEQSYGHELMLNPEGRIVGGSIHAIMEKLTSYNTTPEPSFVSMVYLTFRLFATPIEFVQALSHRFDYVEQTPRIADPVRHRVANTLKGWLESHWRHDCDAVAIPVISRLIKEKITYHSPITGRRLSDLLNIVATSNGPAVPRLVSSVGKTNTALATRSDAESAVPAVTLSKSQLNALRTWKMGGAVPTVTDFDPLEIARQLTIKTSSIFCSILPEELLGNEFQKKSNSLAVNVRAMSTLSTDLANMVTESILQMEEPKRRAAVIKHWIKIAKKCVKLHNYDALMAIHASINSSTILRLKRTWELISPKSKTTFEELGRIVEPSKNFSTLRQVINESLPPCLPYVGMYLTDLTFIDHGNSSTRELKTGNETISVINLDKHMKTAKVISELQRFQMAYRLASIDELQTWIQSEFIRVRANGEKSFQVQYRRSLLLEPRDQQQIPTQRPKMHAFASMTNLGNKDFLSWAHTNRIHGPTTKEKERYNSVNS